MRSRAKWWGISVSCASGPKVSAWWVGNQPRLKALVAADLTADEIGAEMGVTKNAVIGRVYRTGLTLARARPDRHMVNPMRQERRSTVQADI